MDPNYFLYVEDVDFCYEVIMHGYHITCTKDSIIYHKEGKSTELKPTMTYYNTRNRLYFAHKMKEPFRRKILFYLYFGFTRIIKARECKIVCVNRYCMNLLYAPYWGKQR